MFKNTPIVVVEDDKDDQELMNAVFKELKIDSPVLFFDLTEEAYNYLKTTSDVPFIIICDVNLPKQNGLEFKRKIDSDKQLRQKSIPFIFYSTSTIQKTVDTAYAQLTIQGFFEKPTSLKETKNIMHLILQYWFHCKHPNSFNQRFAVKKLK